MRIQSDLDLQRWTLSRREIEELEGASEQHLAVFGPKIPLVDKAIKRYIGRFKKPPIGPVGAFVKLKGKASFS